jgi:hypothetical protein
VSCHSKSESAANKKRPTQCVGLKILASEEDCQNLRDLGSPNSVRAGHFDGYRDMEINPRRVLTVAFNRKQWMSFFLRSIRVAVDPQCMARSIASPIDSGALSADQSINESFVTLIERIIAIRIARIQWNRTRQWRYASAFVYSRSDR